MGIGRSQPAAASLVTGHKLWSFGCFGYCAAPQNLVVCCCHCVCVCVSLSRISFMKEVLSLCHEGHQQLPQAFSESQLSFVVLFYQPRFPTSFAGDLAAFLPQQVGPPTKYVAWTQLHAYWWNASVSIAEKAALQDSIDCRMHCPSNF